VATVQIRYRLSESGRRASLLAGGDGRDRQCVEVPATQELIAISEVSSEGVARIFLESPGYGYDAPIADPAAVAIAEAAARQAQRAEEDADAELRSIARDAQIRADVAAYMADSTSRRVGTCAILYIGNRRSGPSSGETLTLPDDLDYVLDEHDRRCAIDAQIRVDAAHREAEEREAWIRAHGSERLRRHVAEGIEYSAVYRDEHAAWEAAELDRMAPGWVYGEVGGSDEPRSVSDEVLALLDVARESLPGSLRASARIRYVRDEKWVKCDCTNDDGCTDPDCDEHDRDGEIKRVTQAWAIIAQTSDGRQIRYADTVTTG